MSLLDLLLGSGRPATPVGPRLTHPAVHLIRPAPRFAWDEKRWRRVQDSEGIHYVGQYRVWDRGRRQWRTFEGRLVEQSGIVSAYIADPPPDLRHHRHGPCFQLVKTPWFRVHWERYPEHPDAALLYIEQLLSEGLNDRIS